MGVLVGGFFFSSSWGEEDRGRFGLVSRCRMLWPGILCLGLTRWRNDILARYCFAAVLLGREKEFGGSFPTFCFLKVLCPLVVASDSLFSYLLLQSLLACSYFATYIYITSCFLAFLLSYS